MILIRGVWNHRVWNDWNPMSITPSHVTH